MYNTSVGGVLEKNKAGNGARACWDVTIQTEKASVRRCHLNEDLKEGREQVVWMSREFNKKQQV